MAGEFLEATRLSDSTETKLSFATSIVNPVALYQDNAQALVHSEQTNNSQEGANPCPPWKKPMAACLAVRYGIVPPKPPPSPWTSIPPLPIYQCSRCGVPLGCASRRPSTTMRSRTIAILLRRAVGAPLHTRRAVPPLCPQHRHTSSGQRRRHSLVRACTPCSSF